MNLGFSYSILALYVVNANQSLFQIDVFVLVACPEESIVDSKEYLRPICTPYEAELACNANREWANIYPLDFRQLLPGIECKI